MKTGIITFHWSDNYGAVLQTYALQSFLQERGHEVQVIDYNPQGRRPSWRVKWLSKNPAICLLKWAQNVRESILRVLDIRRHALFESFRKGNLACTPERFCSANELTLLKDRYETVIVGSDQVWNPNFLYYLSSFDAYFSEFAGKRTRRVSYAASFGRSDVSDIKPEWQDLLVERLRRMDAISVREPSGVDLVREICGRADAVQVADPTLLLGREHYDRLAGDGGESSGGLFSYLLHGLEEKASPLLCALASKNSWPLTCCNPQRKKLLGRGAVLSPIEWLRAIRDAEFVVTNCLIFHKPFAVLPLQGDKSAMNNRLTELLNAVGLEERITSSSETASALVRSLIDWQAVDERIAAMRDRAVDFLSIMGF